MSFPSVFFIWIAGMASRFSKKDAQPESLDLLRGPNDTHSHKPQLIPTVSLKLFQQRNQNPQALFWLDVKADFNDEI